MEQQKAATKPKSKILKFLPRATSSVSFQNPPLYSPNKDKRSSEKSHKSNLGKPFSGPPVSIVPSQNRRKIKNNSTYNSLVFEPTSPRVSCMGQIKCKKTQNKVDDNNNKDAKVDEKDGVKSKKKLGFGRIFQVGVKKSNKSSNKCSKIDLSVPKAPCLSTMKRFSSGREAFTSFDWTTQVTPLDSEIVMPSSAPVVERNNGFCGDFVRVGGVNMEPRKEVNLWKRRTMAQPQPLQLCVASN